MSTITNLYGIEIYQPYLPYGRVKVRETRTSFIVSLAEAKEHLRIDSSFTADDTYITALTKIAQNIVEKETGLYLSSIALEYTSDGFLPILDLGANGHGVTSVKYYDSSNSQQTLDSNSYDISNLGYLESNVLLYPNTGTDWPQTFDRPDSVEVKFSGGINETYQIPEGLKEAIYLIIGRYYEVRQDVLSGTVVYQVPLGAQHLINQYKKAVV